MKTNKSAKTLLNKQMEASKTTRMLLDKRFKSIKNTLDITRPVHGWIKTIRNALGMTSAQLGKRLGITQARISAMEAGEIENSLTLKTIKETAAALNCRFVYFFIPEKSLEETISEQGIQFMKNQTSSITNSENLDSSKIQADDILLKYSNKIWDIKE